MLQVGLTGGIGSGKSTVARLLIRHGAVLIDSDVLAREVVAPGTEGLAEIVAAFGPTVLDGEGALHRPALAAVVFADRAARERLNGIVHPRVRRRSNELIAAAPADAVVVQDIPLLVEGGMGPRFPLVIVVHAPADERIERLVRQRGMAEADARARVAAQADDEARRAVADVWLDNSGAPNDLDDAVAALWRTRLVPFEENLRMRRVAPVDPTGPVAPNPGWALDGARLAARIAAAAGDRTRAVEHVGRTAVPGLPAEDVIELQLGVAAPDDVDSVAAALSDAGFPSGPGRGQHGSADPGRPARVFVRPTGSLEWRNALLLRDWRRTVRAAGLEPADDGLSQAEEWAAVTEWAPSFG